MEVTPGLASLRWQPLIGLRCVEPVALLLLGEGSLWRHRGFSEKMRFEHSTLG